jgi:hypothetical protein
VEKKADKNNPPMANQYIPLENRASVLLVQVELLVVLLVVYFAL